MELRDTLLTLLRHVEVTNTERDGEPAARQGSQLPEVQAEQEPGGGSVASSRTMLAVGLAAATLVVIVVVIAMGGAVRAGLAPWPGIGVAVLAIAAFAVSRERSSLVVAGLLAASGVVGVVYGLMRTDFLMASSFPGPIFGIILGLPILGLAVAEAVAATRARRSSTRSRGEARYPEQDAGMAR